MISNMHRATLENRVAPSWSVCSSAFSAETGQSKSKTIIEQFRKIK